MNQATTLKEINLPGLKYQYFASSEGRIYRWTGESMLEQKGWLEHSRQGYTKRYYRVWLSMSIGRAKKFYKHRLVCTAWHGSPEPGEECRHLDDDEFNNTHMNLAWGTRQQNVDDKKRNNTDTGKWFENDPTEDLPF